MEIEVEVNPSIELGGYYAIAYMVAPDHTRISIIAHHKQNADTARALVLADLRALHEETRQYAGEDEQ